MKESQNRKRTNDIKIENNITFSELVLSDDIMKAIDEIGYIRPSPIQLKAIPLGISGQDLIAQAKSGTGKTAVFGIIAIEHILKEAKLYQNQNNSRKSLLSNQDLLNLDDETYAEIMSGVPRKQMVLIISPTREIAIQITQVINQLAKYAKRIKAESFIGGSREADDVKKLIGTQIVVGTPGRIKSLIENLELRTENIKMLILDEADKLLDPSFSKVINWIYTTLPKEKQTLAFSATYPESLLNLLVTYMKNPVQIRLCSDTPSLEGIKQYYQIVGTTSNNGINTSLSAQSYDIFRKKVNSCLILLQEVSFYQAIIFCNHKSRAEELSRTLTKEGWPAYYISGDQTQKDRSQTMQALKNFQLRVLVSTDLISRGIDIERVNLVINLDVPKDYETYFHRIGRTGRFGTYGVAISYLSESEKSFISDLIELYDVQISQRKDHDIIPEEFYNYQLTDEMDQKSLEQLKQQRNDYLLNKNNPSEDEDKEVYQEEDEEYEEEDEEEYEEGKSYSDTEDYQDYNNEEYNEIVYENNDTSEYIYTNAEDLEKGFRKLNVNGGNRNKKPNSIKEKQLKEQQDYYNYYQYYQYYQQYYQYICQQQQYQNQQNYNRYECNCPNCPNNNIHYYNNYNNNNSYNTQHYDKNFYENYYKQYERYYNSK
ncbi:putative RNA helicase [Tieghemostelium lacteum]|uniref:RNA helicase n=1 Tax=Tieghemostelium lacteum TaxID=361077 RepID=A0A151Z3Q5_TIELA|nr:putative RNA helicase [Tieghemostelium lacteum]|eukprot:KYQ88603.1 putative RNA helicase [Tieghemostelium lacteum]